MWLFILLSFLLLTSLNLDSPAVSDLQGKVSKWSSDVNKIKAPLEFIIKTDRAALGERQTDRAALGRDRQMERALRWEGFSLATRFFPLFSSLPDNLYSNFMNDFFPP